VENNRTLFPGSKIDDPECRERIRRAPDPKTAANFGGSRKIPIRSDWEEIKNDVAKKGRSKEV